jgi:endonuclease YncB( thermonuclease family)
MKKILLFVLFMTVHQFTIAQKQPTGVAYDVQILRVIDGDTVAFHAPFLPDPLKKELSIRIYGVDTPEKGHRAKCPSEDQKGQAATEFTKNLVQNATKRQIVLYTWDKYGGRVLGDIVLNGQSLRQLLISKGYAREYYGEAKTSWC